MPDRESDHSSNPGNLRILLVEDHASTAATMVKLLEHRGHHLSLALTANEALLLASRAEFDLLISDLGLPDMHGWELLTKIREKKPNLPAIAISGFGREPELKRSEVAGFDAHLTKPARIVEVETAISKLFPASPVGPRPSGEDPRMFI